ncbi:LPXTG cell wall anchor domain-containing protein, partial [Streptococcus mitis]
VDDKGNATVTDPTTGSSATIPSSDLVEKAKEATPVTPVTPVTPAKTEVKDSEHLTDKEKEAVKDKVEKANPGKNVTVDDKGNATVTDPTTGSSATIPSSDLVEKAKEETPVTPVTPAKTEVKDPEAKTPVKDPANLTDAEKAKVAEEVKKSNPTATDVKVGKDGTTTVSFPDGSTAVIPADKAVAKANDSEGVQDPSATAVKDPSNLTDADKAKAASNGSQATSAQANARKVAKELPNTGTADSTVAMVAAAASALLGLGLAGRRRKEDEEA